MAFLAVGIAATIYLILDRLDYLKSEAQLEAVISRESSFLFNNLVLLASCFAVLWGTLFPGDLRSGIGREDQPGCGLVQPAHDSHRTFPALPDRRGPAVRVAAHVDRKPAPELSCGPASLPWCWSAALIAAGMRDFYALISFGFCLFVAVTIIIEFFKGAKQIAAKNQINFAHAVVELTHRNTRRYGGYLVHMGIVLMFIGFTGAAFNKNRIDEMKPGDSVRLGPIPAHGEGHPRRRKRKLSLAEGVRWQSPRTANSCGVLTPESRVYKASRQPTHEVAVRPRLNEDLYLNFAGMNGDRVVIQSYIFPLVSWIWIGALTLIFGTLVALVPSKVKREYARTQVVGITRKHATVEK